MHNRYQRPRSLIFALLGALWVLLIPLVQADEPQWLGRDSQGEPQVHLYFFWSTTCQHCLEARPFVEGLPRRIPWLVLHSLDVGQRGNAEQYIELAASLGQEARSVPAFFFCGTMAVGYHRAEDTGEELVRHLEACRGANGGPPFSEQLSLFFGTGGNGLSLLSELPEIPLLGRLDPQRVSLPVYTLVIAGLDAFNPCAFFVLLFLLSLLVHAKSRARMLFIGGVFVLFSGLLYFLFMAAWLNLFLWLGELRLVTLGAGALAVLVAFLNIKDYFWFKAGISLSIPDSVKPKLYQRMRGLIRADSMPPLILGTVALAIVANSFELLCTAGFPMIYTRILTLSGLNPLEHYLYLGLYTLIYILPLFAIVLVFTCTLGSRKLSEAEGRLLKLLSGLMMLGLGVALLLAPSTLNNPLAAIALLAAAVGLAWMIHRSGGEQVGQMRGR